MNRKTRTLLSLCLVAAASVLIPRAAQAARIRAVVAGGSQSCAVTDGGAAWCWGLNDSGQLGDGTEASRRTPTAVSGLTAGVTTIVAGFTHTCAVTTTGAMLCWGGNFTGQLGDGTTTGRSIPGVVSGLGTGVVAAAAGDGGHTCAVTSAGAVLCWGANSYGQLGDGTTATRLAPVPVSGLATGVVSIAAGWSHTCALTSAGGVLCWGRNSYGQLGDGTTTNRLTPTPAVGLGSGVAAITADGSNTCALTVAGGVLCWGGRTTPTPVEGLGAGVVEVTAGKMHTCALTSAGGVLCWGVNLVGELGNGTTTSSSTPVAVVGLSGGVAAVSAGGQFSCALTVGGALLCWGANNSGQLGDGTRTHRSTPVSVVGLGGSGLSAGASHSCRLVYGGGAQCWGRGVDGQLGDGTAVGRSVPVAVSGVLVRATALAAGNGHTCAALSAGVVQCWGRNDHGQLGDGTTTSRAGPAAVGGLSSAVVAVAAGDGHSCSLAAAGTVQCWGRNDHGQLGDGTTVDRAVPVTVTGLTDPVTALAAGAHHTCAVTAAGGVRCWGANDSGQLGDGTASDQANPVAVVGLGPGVQSVAVGISHSCAVTSGAAVVCWGDNDSGQLGDGTTAPRATPVGVVGLASGVVAATAGGDFTCALTALGGVTCWGANASGQLGDGTTTARLTAAPVNGLAADVVAVSAGSAHACAGMRGGRTWCWGRNDDGQLGDSTTMNLLTPVTVGTHRPRGDVDGNGTSDVLWRHQTRNQVWLWSMAGTTVTAETYVATVEDSGWTIQGLDDHSGDGTADPLWRHASRATVNLWRMSGPVVAEISSAATNPNHEIVGVADFTGDGRSDILWRDPGTSGSRNADFEVWRMEGDTVVTTLPVVWLPVTVALSASGDLNGDGTADLVWRDTTTGGVWVWLMDGPAPTSQTLFDSIDPDYVIVASADYNGDGKSDLLWRHSTNGDIWLWQMDGSTLLDVTYLGTVSDVDYRIVGSGDYDGDGRADVLWHHATRGEVWLWLMDGAAITSAAWIATVYELGYRVEPGR